LGRGHATRLFYFQQDKTVNITLLLLIVSTLITEQVGLDRPRKLVQKRGVSRGPLNLGLCFQPNNTLYWSLQQFREALPGDHPYRFVIHDRDRIFAEEVDKDLAHLGVRVLRTLVRAPKANSVCERLGGSLRQESSRLVDSLKRTPSANDVSGLGNPL
jgi:hypothetical protein